MTVLVSIIMPAYNAADYIEESIVSAQNQTFTNWELIVVDDGSTDHTAEIVKTLQDKDQRIVYIHQSNKRLGAARNAGLRAAKGQYIAFLDSDDLWMPEKLEKQVTVFSDPSIDVVYTRGFKWFFETNRLEDYPTKTGIFTGEQMYQMQYIGNHIPVLSVLFKREWIKKVGYQDENSLIFGCEDYDYWIRMANHGAKFFGMEEPLFKYRVHSNAMSNNYIQMKLAEITAMVKNINANWNQRVFFAERISSSIKTILPQLLEQNHRFAALSMAVSLWKLQYKPQYLLLWIHIFIFNKGFKSLFYMLLLKK